LSTLVLTKEMLLPSGVLVSPHVLINFISVLTESLGPIGQMCAKFAFLNGASRVIIIDANWRLDFVKEKIPEVETLDYSKLPRGTSITAKLKEMVPRGPDVALECVAGEYPKGWAHYFELLLGFETDTSEILNEMITSVKNYGRCGITGDYVGYVCSLFHSLPRYILTYPQTNHFNIGSLMERGVRLIGNGQAPVQKYWKDLLKKIESGEIDPLIMVSHRFDISEMDQVYYKFDKKEDNIQKVFVQTRFSQPPAPGSPALTTIKK
jgi:threonine dehydrogenase-like Zn-dependent dehydrogenase